MLGILTRTALARPHHTLLGLLILIVGGSYAFSQLPIDAFPDVSAPQVKIIVKAPGMTPEEMETRVTALIEVELLGLPRQTMLRSTTKYGLTDITLDFADGTDIYWARSQVSERLNAVWANLPDGVSGGLAPITTPLGEMFMFTVDGPQSLTERRTLLDWVIRPALRSVAGVADVNALGGRVATYEVVPDAARMAATAVSLEQLQSALRQFNRNEGAGRISEGEEALLVRIEGRLDSIEAIGNLVVRNDGRDWLRVRDVAEVRLSALNRQGGVTQNGGGETVEGLVLGLKGANAAKVVAGVKARLAELAPTLPAGVSITPFYDRSELVAKAVHTVAKALLEAVALVVVLLVIFLGSARAAIAVAVVLPLSALWTFILMNLTGLSANLMSLGGLAIAIGMLVDAAVVVVENIVERLQDPTMHHKPGPVERRSLILEAVQEVSIPVTAGIAIIALVFVPLLSLQGLEGKLFAPVALTIMYALAGSLFLSLTCIPMLAEWLIQSGHHAEPWLPRMLGAIYAPCLKASLRRPRVVGVVAVALLAGAALLYPRIGKIFMPTMDEGSIIVQLEKLPAINLDSSLALDSQFQRAVLARVPEVSMAVARAGSDEIGLDPMGLNQTDTFLALKPTQEWRGSKDDIQSALRDVLADFPGIAYTFTQPIEMRVSEMILGVRGDLAIRIFGPDLAVLNAKATEIAHVLEGVSGSEDVYHVANEGVQYLRIRPDTDALARQGLSVDSISALLRSNIEGTAVGVIQEPGRPVPLMLRASGATQSPESLAALTLMTPNGQRVTVGQLVNIERVSGPVLISRELGSRNSVVIANVTGRDLVGFVAEARSTIEREVELPKGYRLTWGGEFENQQRAAERLGLVVPAALVLIFFLLYSVFDSMRQSLLVLTNVPFALIGGVVALFISGEYLSVPASVGFIALLGIAVLNGVVLMSYFNQLRATGMPILEVVLQGAARRFRPVMLTASMTATGLIPMLYATGPGSEIQRPLAIVVIGGLVSSTLLTLILLPLLYLHFESKADDSAVESQAFIT
jgi:heavy metal efflux system protein